MNNNKKENTQPIRVNRTPPTPKIDGGTIPVPTMKKPIPPGGPAPLKPNAIPDFVIQSPVPKKAKKAGRFWRRSLLILGGILLILILGGIGGWLGYNQAVANRIYEQDKNKIGAAVTQYEMGVVDMKAGRLEVARQRFEYVIRIDPSFPGAAQGLTQVMMAMTTVTVPTMVLSPTPVPTPDNRNIDQKFTSAVAEINTQDWDHALDTLMDVRKTDPTYHAIDIDGFLYTALRQRGLKKITSGQLEPGIYDLALAEKLAPLDHDADGFRALARQYIIGASFWGFDWGQVYDYFKQIVAGNSGMLDATGKTAQQRFAYAAAMVGDSVMAASTPDYCSASSYYAQAAQSGITGIGATQTKAAYQCNPPTSAFSATATITGAATATITPTPGGATSTTGPTATTGATAAATTAVPPAATTKPAATTAVPPAATTEAPTAKST